MSVKSTQRILLNSKSAHIIRKKEDGTYDMKKVTCRAESSLADLMTPRENKV